MVIEENKDICCGCGACELTCPRNCITMVSDEEGFEYPQIDKNRCVNCGLCKNVCPVINHKYSDEKPQCFASYSKDSCVRINSSSGGVFTELASQIIKNGGVVCGAMFDENFNLAHSFADTIEGIDRLRGSKYIQSKTTKAFEETKKLLDKGKMVLFSGTPCQIQGLLNFLKKPYDNLITQDIICHGVPSEKLWRAYCQSINASVPTYASFRDKKYGWRNYSYIIKFNDKSVYCRMHNDDAYSNLFLKNLSLRPSCYLCAFKGERSASDLTIGDFWGVEEVLPDIDYKNGVSLVVVNTPKGEELFSAVKHRLCCEHVDLDKALHFNIAKLKSASRPQDREYIYKDLNNNGFDFVRKKYLKEHFIVKIKRKIKNVVKKFLK